MTRFIPHPKIFCSLLAPLSRRGYCSEAQGGSRRVSRFAVSLAAGLPLWKRVTQDGLFPEATLQRELMINPSYLVCRTFLTAGDFGSSQPVCVSCQAVKAAQRVVFMSFKIRVGAGCSGRCSE